jgi:predicted nuclease with TOPRIM domain
MNELKKKIITYSVTFITGFLLCLTLFYAFKPDLGGYDQRERDLLEQHDRQVTELEDTISSLEGFVEELRDNNRRLRNDIGSLEERKRELADNYRRTRERLVELESIIERQRGNNQEARDYAKSIDDGIGDIIDDFQRIQKEQSGSN